MLNKILEDKYIIAVLLILIIACGIISVVGDKNKKGDNSVSYSVERESEIEIDSRDEVDKSGKENITETKSETKDSENDKAKTNQSEMNQAETGETETDEALTAISEEEQNEINLDKKTDKIVKKMSVEEKILQMFIVTPEQLTGVAKATKAGEITKKALEDMPVGGILFFAGNIINPEQTKSMISGINDYSKIKPFICVDEEGGTVARVAGNSSFNVKKYSNAYDVPKSEVYDMGKTIGTYLAEYGFNLDFAPVADINSNPNNPVIGKRAFGSDAETVANAVSDSVKGMHDAGVLCAIKHFPGHGDTNEDSHYGMASTSKTLEELKEFEFIPFVKGIDAGTDLVMVGHINVPAVDDVPASLSKKIITDTLKKDIGYKGLIVTDALNMKAITDKYAGKECLMAIDAGVDLILMPADFKKSYQQILDAVNEGTISEKRIDESVKKIIRKKLESGIHG